MRSCSKVIALLILVLFCISLPVSLLVFNFDSYLLSPKPYIQAMQDEALAAQLPELVAAQLSYSMSYTPCLEDPANCENGLEEPAGSDTGMPSYLRQLSEQQWKTVLATLLDADWLQSQAEQLLRAFFANLEPGATRVPIVISLQPMKDRLAGPQGIALIDELLASQPACTPAQLLELATMDLSQPDLARLLACQPPADVMALVQPELQNALQQAAQQIPATIHVDILESLFSGSTGGTGDLPFVRARATMRLSPLVPLTLLLLAGLFAVRSVREAGLWIGLPLALSAASTAGVAWFAPGVVERVIESFITPALPGALSPGTNAFLLQMVLRVGQLMAERIAFQAVLLAIGGGALLLIGLMARPARRVDSIAPLTRPRDGANEGR